MPRPRLTRPIPRHLNTAEFAAPTAARLDREVAGGEGLLRSKKLPNPSLLALTLVASSLTFQNFCEEVY